MHDTIWCKGYTSDGSSGDGYAQPRHEVPRADFGTKNICKECYRAYARDWRVKNDAKKGVSRTARGRGGRAIREVRTDIGKAGDLTVHRFTALVEADDDVVSDEDLAASPSHEFVPQKDVLDTWAAVTQVAATGVHPFNLLFLGPSGSGKTECAMFLAAQAGLPFTKVDAAAMTDPESWFGTREIRAEDGVPVTDYRPSTFVLALEEPGVLLIDELNRVRDEHRNVLLPLLDGTHQVTNPLTGEAVVKHPQCFIIGTGNRGSQFTGTYAVDPALMTRMITLEFEYAPADVEERVLVQAAGVDPAVAQVLVRFGNDVRARSKEDPEVTPISTRELITTAKLVSAGLDIDTAAKVCIMNTANAEGGPESERGKLEMIWTGLRPAETIAAAKGGTCLSSHGFMTDTNGQALMCTLGPGHADQHVGANGVTWR